MNWLHHLAHLAAAALAVVGAHLGGGPGGPVATGGTSASIQAGPACVTHTIQPGQSATVGISVVNSTRTTKTTRAGWEKLNMSQQTALPGYVIQYAAPRSWIKLSAPGPGNWVGPHRAAVSHATVTVPAGAKRGRYTALIQMLATVPAQSGSGKPAALGSSAQTGLVFSVGPHVSPPPRAFCEGKRLTYWPAPVLLPMCKAGQPPLQGRQAVCRVLPLPPPVANAKNCHLAGRHASAAKNAKAWADYEHQLTIAVQKHYPGASLADAHCYIGPPGFDGTSNLLNRMQVYRHPFRFGWWSAPHYRFPDVPARYR